MSFEIEKFKKKLVYRSQYRGTKEMDKLIGSFVKRYINELNADDLKDLEIFLDLDDDTLYKYYTDENTITKISESKISNLFKKYIYK